MSLSGLKSLLGSAAELLKSNKTESAQPGGLSENSRKDKTGNLLAANLSYDSNALDAVTNRFLKARDANVSVGTISLQSYSAETVSDQKPTPKAVIIPLKEGKKNATHEELSRRLVQATLEQNGIKPSNIEMEEIMALPQNQAIDMNGWFGKDWKFNNLPGSMPAPAKYKDAGGRQVFGYGLKLSPDWQAEKLNDYKQVRGELSKPENVNRKAVIDMKMTERLNETVKIAWEKGYISEEVKNQLGNITPKELAAAFTIGGLIGILGTTEAGAAALGPIGGAIGLAYTAKQMAEFDHIADGAARATNRRQLDKPAQEFGAFLGSLSKDGVLALVGMAGGAIAPRTMPQVESALTNKVGNVKQILKEGLPKLDEPRLATPNGAPIQSTNIKTSTGKTALENNEPLKISISSDEANLDHIRTGKKPPYGGTRARDVVLDKETVFVRVHGEDNQASSWMMRKEDIEGLTARQIKDKFALPELPKYVSDVHVPKGTRLFIGKVAQQKGWGKGGGIQYELKGDRLPLSTWRNRRPIK